MIPIPVKEENFLATEPTPLIGEQQPEDVTLNPAVPLPSWIVNYRTSRAAYGLGELSMPYDEIGRRIASGDERGLREEAAAKFAVRKQIDVNTVLQKVAEGKGGPLTTDETRSITARIIEANKWADPGSVLERGFAHKYLNTLYGVAPVSSWVRAAGNDEISRMIKDVGEEFVVKDQIFANWEQEAEAARQQQSWPSYIGDRARDVFTLGLWSEFKQRGNFFPFFLGENIREQRAGLWALDPATLVATGGPMVKEMIKSDPALALHYIQKLRGNADVDIDNLLTGVTVATLPGAGTLTKGAASLAARSTRAIKDMAKGTASTEPPAVSSAVAAGELGEAGISKATSKIVGNLTSAGVDPIKIAVDPLLDILQESSLAIAKNPGKGPGSQEVANRIIQQYDDLGSMGMNVLSNMQRANRLPETTAAENAARLFKEEADQKYSGMSARVVGLKHHRDNRSNIQYWEVQLGRHNGELFGSEDSAKAAAKIGGIGLQGTDNMARQVELERQIAQLKYEIKYSEAALDPSEETRALLGLTEANRDPKQASKLADMKADLSSAEQELSDLRTSPGATIQPQGGKFYISWFIPLDETSKAARALLNTTPKSQATTGFMRSIFGWLRGPEETESRDAQAMAKSAIYGAPILLDMARAELAPYHKLNRFLLPGTAKKQWAKDLDDVLTVNRQEGKMYDHPGQLEDIYLRQFGRFPEPIEKEAYFAVKRYGELLDSFYNLNLYREESRIGATNWRVSTNTADGIGKQSQSVKGVQRDVMPKDEEGILIMGTAEGDESIRSSLSLSGKNAKGVSEMDRMNAAIKTGEAKLVELLYPIELPLKDFTKNVGSNYVRFIYSNKLESTPLQLSRAGRQANGMWDLDYPWYLKQAILRPDQVSKTIRYIGDRTIMPFANGALGREILKHIENVRVALRDGNETAAQNAARPLPMEWEEVRDWFKPKVTADGKSEPAMLDVNHEIRLVPGNKLIVNMDKRLQDSVGSAFRDDTKGNLILKNFIKDTERDAYELYTVRDVGSRNNPLYKYEPAEYVNVLPSLNRSLKTLVNSTLMQDYKHYAIEHWVKNAAPYLDASPEALARSPAYYFFHGKYSPGTPIDVQSRLTDSNWKSQRIWGTPSTLETWLHQVAQHGADKVYEKLGPKAAVLEPTWMLHATLSAPGFLKAAVFHPVIGLFGPAQWFVQNMTHATIFGVEGVRPAAAGTWAGQLFYWSRVNQTPAILDMMDRWATKLKMPGGWSFKAGQWKEAREGMLNNGFDKIAADVSLTHDPLAVNVIKSGTATVLDAGQFFFREGDKSVRASSWFVSYLKYRHEVQPIGKIGEEGWRQIFMNAEDLAGNMSAASRSMLQVGPMQFFTQFMGYAIRTVELATGKRLTGVQRAQLFGTYMALFGVYAGGLSGWPIGDTVRRAAINNGYTGEEAQRITTWMMEGVPSEALKLMTGKHYGIGAKLGDPSFSPIRDVLYGDKSAWQLFGGAAWNFYSNAWESTDGLRRALMSIIRDEDTFFPITANDAMRVMNNVQSVNYTNRYIRAWSTGDWIDRSGQVLETDVSRLAATMMTITGVQPQSVPDRQMMNSLISQRKRNIEEIEKDVMREGLNWIEAVRNRDYDNAKVYGSRIHSILKFEKYPTTLIPALMSRIDNAAARSGVDRSLFNFYLGRDVSDEEIEKNANTYEQRFKGR